MVEVSNLYNLKIYTVDGMYIGKIVDVVLNIKLGIISKLKVKTYNADEKKDIGLVDIIRTNLQMVPDEDQINVYTDEVFDIEYAKVKAIGDIMLIDPKNLTPSREEDLKPPQTNQTLTANH
ncbi:MAG: PRC-barrel domain-containing protein [Methanobrevibacter sp.]|nr:PRC-barrel domain-containing protein [Methanobrevibacter sp.]